MLSARMRFPALLLAILFASALAGCVQPPAQAPATAEGVNETDCSLNDTAYSGGLGMDTTLLAELQDQLLWCIGNNSTFDNNRALSLLGSFWPETQTGIGPIDDMNPLLWNNLAIRSDLIRMLILQRNDSSYAPDFGPVLSKIGKYGFQSDGYTTWYEGSGYLAYTLAAVEQANLHFEDAELRDFQTSSVRWLDDFALPDGTLAPIGDTGLNERCPSCAPNASDRMVYSDHETAIFFDNGSGYLLLRHPMSNSRPASVIRNDLHTQFDFGAVYLWYNGSWLIRPIGYPGYDMKTADTLDDKYDYNIQSADRIGGDFTQADFNGMDALRYLGSWRAETTAIIPDGAVQRNEYPDRYELRFSYELNTGEGGAYENYSRTVILYKGRKDLEIIDNDPQNESSHLMVSDDVNVTSAAAVSCDDSGRWSPAWGVVNDSVRCAIGPAQALDYSVQWR